MTTQQNETETGAGAATPVVLVVGATSAAGHAVVRAIAATGRSVLALSRSEERLGALRDEVPAIRVRALDATDGEAIEGLRDWLEADGLRVGSIVHLVGGWRGSDHGIAGQRDDDWAFLEASLRSLRVVTRTFVRDVANAPGGRVVTVSSTATRRPRANTATYAAIKSATEAWTKAVADELRGTSAAATVIVAKSLANHEADLGERVVQAFAAPSEVVNGQLIDL